MFSVMLELLTVTGVMDVLTWLYSPLTKLAGLNSSAAVALLAGGVEMTAGCARVAALSADMTVKLMLASGIVAFGGLSVHMQTRAVCAPSGLVLKRFVIAKTIQGTVASALTALLLAVFPLSQTVSTISADTKTAAFGGVIFATCTIVVLLLIKLWQRLNPSSYWTAPTGSCGELSNNRQGSFQALPKYRRRTPSRRL